MVDRMLHHICDYALKLSYRDLPPEVTAVQLAATQQRPELAFCLGRGFAHLPGESDQASAVVAFAGHGRDLGKEASRLSKQTPSPALPRSTGGGSRGRDALSRASVFAV